MLFDPFEKQFDLPAAAIKVGDALRRKIEMVGQKDQRLSLCIFDLDTSDCRGEMLLRIKAGQRTQLVADDAGRAVCRQGVSSSKAQIRLGACHEEASRLVQAMKSCEVQIAEIHDVERTSLGNDLVEDVHVVQFAITDVDEAGNVAAQVEQRMQLDGRLGRPKRSPRKYRQAQIDRGRIQCVDCLLEIDAKRLVHVKRARNSDQALREVGVDAPVANRIRIGQRVARYRAAKTYVVELGGLAAQTGFDVAQTLSIGQLCEGHAQKLVETREVFDLVLPIVANDTSAESGQRQHHRDKTKGSRVVAFQHGIGAIQLQHLARYAPTVAHDLKLYEAAGKWFG